MLFAAMFRLADPQKMLLGVAATTSKEIEQFPFAGMVPPAKVPEVAVDVRVPPQVVARLLGDANAICAGKVKVVAAFVSAIVFGLLSVTVNL
ncbi:hypothetical protein D3C72_2042530 [compost metagenome]